MKINFNSDGKLPLNITIINHNLAIVVRVVFYRNKILSAMNTYMNYK